MKNKITNVIVFMLLFVLPVGMECSVLQFSDFYPEIEQIKVDIILLPTVLFFVKMYKKSDLRAVLHIWVPIVMMLQAGIWDIIHRDLFLRGIHLSSIIKYDPSNFLVMPQYYRYTSLLAIMLLGLIYVFSMKKKKAKLSMLFLGLAAIEIISSIVLSINVCSNEASLFKHSDLFLDGNFCLYQGSIKNAEVSNVLVWTGCGHWNNYFEVSYPFRMYLKEKNGIICFFKNYEYIFGHLIPLMWMSISCVLSLAKKKCGCNTTKRVIAGILLLLCIGGCVKSFTLKSQQTIQVEDHVYINEPIMQTAYELAMDRLRDALHEINSHEKKEWSQRYTEREMEGIKALSEAQVIKLAQPIILYDADYDSETLDSEIFIPVVVDNRIVTLLWGDASCDDFHMSIDEEYKVVEALNEINYLQSDWIIYLYDDKVYAENELKREILFDGDWPGDDLTGTTKDGLELQAKFMQLSLKDKKKEIKKYISQIVKAYPSTLYAIREHIYIVFFSFVVISVLVICGLIRILTMKK